MNDVAESTVYPGWRVYLNPRVLGMLFLGFSAGLPLLLVGGTFTAWLRDLNVELAAIGFLSWVGMAHSTRSCGRPLWTGCHCRSCRPFSDGGAPGCWRPRLPLRSASWVWA